MEHAGEFLLAVKAVEGSFYVGDGLAGADTTEGAIRLQQELQGLFSYADFLLHKWNSCSPGNYGDLRLIF